MTVEFLNFATSGGGANWRPYGTGPDGDVTIAANTNLTRDWQYSNLTVNPGVTLKPTTSNGSATVTPSYRMFVRSTCTVNGTLSNAGFAGFDGGAGGVGGSFRNAPRWGPIGGGANGNGGGNGATGVGANGNNGVNINTSFVNYSQYYGMGGAGGNSGAGGAATNAGGASATGGTVNFMPWTHPSVEFYIWRVLS